MPADLRKGSLFLADYAQIVTELSEANPEAIQHGAAQRAVEPSSSME